MKKQGTLGSQVNIAFLGIGSNLGNKKNNIDKAKFYLINNSIKIIKTSSFYETISWPNSKHPRFYNIVIKISTNMNPERLFNLIKLIEKKIGRKKSKINYPRTCDIDILDFNGIYLNFEINKQPLIIPHPRLDNRNFVLFPLFEIEKNWKHPINKKKIYELLGNLKNSSLYAIKKLQN